MENRIKRIMLSWGGGGKEGILQFGSALWTVWQVAILQVTSWSFRLHFATGDLRIPQQWLPLPARRAGAHSTKVEGRGRVDRGDRGEQGGASSMEKLLSRVTIDTPARE